MDEYLHGVTVKESVTQIATPQASVGIHVVIGAAPINLADDPYSVTNVPLLVTSFETAKSLLGYSENFNSYNISESMYTYFKLVNIAPVVFINVLDPKKHITSVSTTILVEKYQATITEQGILLDTLAVSGDENPLVKDEDYIAEFDNDGNVLITILNGNTYANLSVTASKLDPSAITDADIVGGYNAETGIKTGIELVRDVYPKFGKFTSIIIAPGFTSAVVAAALQSKTENINGIFSCETIIDIESSISHYSAVPNAKNAASIVSPHAIPVWPKVKVNNLVINYSALLAAVIAYYDAENGDVPCLSPSNKLIGISGICTADGSEIVLDQQQANMLNGFGIMTAVNMNGWRSWGNNTAAYPDTTELKDRWIGCRRFFSWMENRFITTYFSKVDNPANYRLIEQIVEDENQFCSALVADGKCAGAYIEYNSDENTVKQLSEGKITFHQYLAPYPPAEHIMNTFEFDASLLENALIGGENSDNS